MSNRRLWAVDCETDPFKYGRIPKPFIWGAYNGKTYKIFHSTQEFVAWAREIKAILYAHNGGKFDFMFLLPFIQETKARIIGGRFAEMTLGRAKLRDSFSIIPVPLSAIQKDEIDYSKMEADVRENYMPEIISYLKTDVRVLWNTVNAYREVAGKQLTIASNAMGSCKKLGVNPGRTNFRFDKEFRPYYFGGRTECLQPGTHTDLTVLDIVSSYPRAMIDEHPTGTERFSFRENATARLEAMSDADIQKSFIQIKCFSYGAFPFRNNEGGLDFPTRLETYNVTGWEYLIAKKHNLIKDIEVIRVTVFKDTITFKPYIDKWFAHKQNHPKEDDPVNYTIGKIMQNSCPPPLNRRGWENNLYTESLVKTLLNTMITWLKNRVQK